MESFARLKRVVRFMIGVSHEGYWFPREGKVKHLDIFTDTDWGSSLRDRKSITCMMVRCAGCLLHNATVGQLV